MKQKTLSLLLIILSVAFFICYLWFAVNYTNEGAWGSGIWFVAVGTFLTGVITFFDKTKQP